MAGSFFLLKRPGSIPAGTGCGRRRTFSLPVLVETAQPVGLSTRALGVARVVLLLAASPVRRSS